MNRVKLKISYNGKNFSGFQIQPEKRTVQEELEKTLSFLLKENIRIYASGRTDAEVSALAQICHFDTNCDVDEKRLLSSLNALLPEDISVSETKIVDESFDSRFSAKKKTYMYFFYISHFAHPIYDAIATRINDYANLEKMKEACKYFVGTHDYRSFVSRKSGKTNFVRTIYDAKIKEIGGGLFAFEISGDGFLYNMVRIIFGTIVSVGYGKIKPSEVTDIILSKDRSKAGKTMPAKALLLKSVEYDC